MFDKYKTEFPSYVHMILHKAAINLTPLDMSLSGMTDPMLAESCVQFHHFMLDMLGDMYENAEMYGLKPGELETFLDGRAINAMKQKEPQKTNARLSTARNAACLYQHFLYYIGEQGEANPTQMTLPKEFLMLFQKNSGLKKIPLAIRLAALKHIGLRVEDKDDEMVVTSERYPSMFTAMCALAKASQPPNNFGAFLFCNCEFRRIHGKYTPTYEDYMQPLDNHKRAIADTIHSFALSCGMRISITTYWKVNYIYKSMHVMCLESDGNHLRLRVDGGPKDWYLEQIAQEGDAFKKYFLRHLNYCTACSTSHIGGITDIFGYRKRICCCPNPSFRILNPSADDIEDMIKMIHIRLEAIEAQKKASGKNKPRSISHV